MKKLLFYKDGINPKCDGTKVPNSLHHLIEITELKDFLIEHKRRYVCSYCKFHFIELENLDGSTTYYFE